jgi:hypothetical protein
MYAHSALWRETSVQLMSVRSMRRCYEEYLAQVSYIEQERQDVRSRIGDGRLRSYLLPISDQRFTSNLFHGATDLLEQSAGHMDQGASSSLAAFRFQREGPAEKVSKIVAKNCRKCNKLSVASDRIHVCLLRRGIGCRELGRATASAAQPNRVPALANGDTVI